MKKISFIIPSFNEEENIEGVLTSISHVLEGNNTKEVIVVDNGSTDNTRQIARKMGAKVYNLPDCTVAGLRNFGVQHSHGEILVFLDADVYLTQEWGEKIPHVMELFEEKNKLITGSLVGINDSNNWIEKYWFGPALKKTSVNYMNSGHLILTRNFFNELNGFDEEMETGEDSDLCERAKKSGGIIVNDHDLQVVHRGFPQDITGFFQRERWHGLGDYCSLKQFLRSKPALLSIIQLGIFILSLIAAIWFGEVSFLFMYLIFLGSISVLASLYRFKKVDISLVFTTMLFSLYFIARSFSLFDRLWGKSVRK